ncbi:MAG TPA: histone deacetylase [Gemmataceae bacterium]|nr:histone deacetylase [Gemmataceae bacterium]
MASPRSGKLAACRYGALRWQPSDDRFTMDLCPDRGPEALPVMTLLYTDPLFLRHDTGRHPECADRLRSISARLHKSGLLQRCTAGSYSPLTEEAVSEVHSPEVIARVKRLAWGGHLDADTVMSEESFQVALAAAGACASAVDAVLAGTDRTALCLVRPPGHHATPTHSMGFCLFNNVALAAHRAKKAHGLTRLLVVDWDVHHGNGTQDIFYEDPEVMFFSIHRFGHGFYPGTGDADETGHGRGRGTTRNEPVRYGTPRADYHGQFRNALEESADRIRPELVLLSAGFDAHREDPIGRLGLETEDFAVLTREVLEVAKVHAGGRVVSCLEGGYNLEALAESAEAHLAELLAV